MPNAHELSMDAAQREIDSRAAQGEDMSNATIDPTTYAILKRYRVLLDYGLQFATVYVQACNSVHAYNLAEAIAEKRAVAVQWSVV